MTSQHELGLIVNVEPSGLAREQDNRYFSDSIYFDTHSLPGFRFSFEPVISSTTFFDSTKATNSPSVVSPIVGNLGTEAISCTGPSNQTWLQAVKAFFTEAYSVVNKATETISNVKSIFAQRKYKPVASRVKPAKATLPSEFRIVRDIKGDPLQGLPVLPNHPEDYKPTGRYTQDRKDLIDKVHPEGFLWPEERRLMHHFMMIQEAGFAWTEDEKGRFKDEYFPPVDMPVMEHVPWVLKNIPIPPGIFRKLIDTVKDKIASGAYEPSNSSYRSRWFAVVKKDGTSLRLVHDLQPLNAVTIQDSGLPPHVETLADSCGAKACYGLLDLFVGYDERVLAESSRDYTTFQTPLGTLRLTRLPMGWTNSVPIFHGDVVHTLREEIPDVTIPFIDDAPILGPKSRYELPDGGYETIPGNEGIRRFVWEHFQNLNRVVERIKYVGCTWSGKKAFLCVPEVIIVGHRCTYGGRLPDESRVAKIRNWGPCATLTDVRAFLGTAGLVRIFIKNFSYIAKPLVDLTRKDAEFVWGEEQQRAMDTLKDSILTSEALRPIDYESKDEVILSVDTSYIAIGYVLQQKAPGGGKKRFINRFGSIPLNETEARYSQAKLELYGLFRALRACRLWIIGVENLVVEVDAKYIKGMLNNPDIQPTATINRWIAGILLFHFKLVHVPGISHGPDGLSRRRPQPDDEPEPEDDYEEFIDRAYGFMLHSMNPIPPFFGGKEVETVAMFMKTKDFERVENPYSKAQQQVHVLPSANDQSPVNRKLRAVRTFLETLTRPEGLTEEAFRSFVRYSSDFFVQDNKLWKRVSNGRHQVVVRSHHRLDIIKQAHDELGHKGYHATSVLIRERFWWPQIGADIKWYISTCHLCQTRQTVKITIPPTVQVPAPLFSKIHVDTAFLPVAADGKRYLLHGRCSLTSYPEFRSLERENADTIATWLFEDVICRWGALTEIVTDNGKSYIKALKVLEKKYHIKHIRISGYNSRANGIIEKKHYDVREALWKATDGHLEQWPSVAPAIFWAERVTTRRSMGCSPYFAAHGVHPVLPFDISEATYLAPAPNRALTTTELIGRRAGELMKRQSALEHLRSKVYKARLDRLLIWEKEWGHRVTDFNFAPKSLVLQRNSTVKDSLNHKQYPRYLGPLIVVSRNKGGAYICCELDGSVIVRPIAAFRLIPYKQREHIPLPSFANFVDLTTEELKDLEQSEETGEEEETEILDLE